jgi:hypothetical protein
MPTDSKNNSEHSAMSLRPFGGQAEDLRIDFNQARPWLVTRLLHACVSGTNESQWWRLAVGQRLETLLRIVLLNGPDSLAVRAVCPMPDCGQPMELELGPEDLFSQDARPEVLELTVDGVCIQLRRPQGTDQLAWLEQEYSGPEQAAQCMAASLVVNNPMPWGGTGMSPAGLALIDRGLTAMDPLPAFTLPVCCPHCGQKQDLEIDLETVALQRLYELQQQLIRKVHRLASHYHWPEQEIAALPAWRREAYLTLIERDEKRP